MKKHQRFLVVLLAVILLIGAVPAQAGIQASYYLDSYSGLAWSNGGGSLSFYYDVSAYDFMLDIGATRVVIQRDDGTFWVDAVTYTSSMVPSLLGHNTSGYANAISFVGAPGTRYRAVITIYAGDASGSDSRVITTNAVTA